MKVHDCHRRSQFQRDLIPVVDALTTDSDWLRPFQGPAISVDHKDHQFQTTSEPVLARPQIRQKELLLLHDQGLLRAILPIEAPTK